jgi:hypothetical protein
VLSRKSTIELAILKVLKDGLEVVDEGVPALLSNLVIQSELLERIKAAQLKDSECLKIKRLLEKGKV